MCHASGAQSRYPRPRKVIRVRPVPASFYRRQPVHPPPRWLRTPYIKPTGEHLSSYSRHWSPVQAPAACISGPARAGFQSMTSPSRVQGATVLGSGRMAPIGVCCTTDASRTKSALVPQQVAQALHHPSSRSKGFGQLASAPAFSLSLVQVTFASGSAPVELANGRVRVTHQHHGEGDHRSGLAGSGRAPGSARASSHWLTWITAMARTHRCHLPSRRDVSAVAKGGLYESPPGRVGGRHHAAGSTLAGLQSFSTPAVTFQGFACARRTSGMGVLVSIPARMTARSSSHSPPVVKTPSHPAVR